MLVVTANWAFTDGTVVAGGGRGRGGRAWLRDVRRAAVRFGFGRDGRYRPPARLDIVLAGDTFDCLTSTAWRGGDRPWRGGARAAEARRRVLVGCARRGAPLLAGLAALARRGLRVPVADHRDRPSVATSVVIPVRVTLLPGDRDMAIVEVTAEVAARGATVAPCWSDEMVFIGHGHEFDPACHATPANAFTDRPPTLAESVITDLVVPFAVAVTHGAAPRSAVTSLAGALAEASPVELPGVIAGWFSGAGPGGVEAAVRRGVGDTWRRSVDAWARQARRAPPECGLPASPIESLAAWFAAAKAVPPPAALAGLFDRVAPADVAAPAVVLGHAAPPAGGGPTICLGRPAVRRCTPVAVVRADPAAEVACVVAARQRAAPPTVARCRAGGRPEWLRITDGDPVATAPARDDARVVDAA